MRMEKHSACTERKRAYGGRSQLQRDREKALSIERDVLDCAHFRMQTRVIRSQRRGSSRSERMFLSPLNTIGTDFIPNWNALCLSVARVGLRIENTWIGVCASTITMVDPFSQQDGKISTLLHFVDTTTADTRTHVLTNTRTPYT